MEAIRASLNIDMPFVVENGSAIVIPPNIVDTEGNFIEESDGTRLIILGMEVKYIRSALAEIRVDTGLAFDTFHDLSVEQISQLTGLDLGSAERARNRDYSEPIVASFTDDELAHFLQACQERGLDCVFGGRFLAVTGRGADKGNAVGLLSSSFRSQSRHIVIIGIGDSPNDISMLEAVDYPYLVQRPDGTWQNLSVPNLRRLPAIGPLGFVAMVDDVEKRWFTSISAEGN
jgi:mannosyl-3-phosphoglycerate phosphatase family protein